MLFAWYWESILCSDEKYGQNLSFACSVVSDYATLCTAACQASLSFSIFWSLLKFMSIQSVMPFNHLILCCTLLLPSLSRSIRVWFLMSWLFASGGQSIGASASASVLPVNIQDWFPLGLTGWISLQSKGLLTAFSNTTVQKHQFFGVQLSFWSGSHIHTWLVGKLQLWLYGPLLAE